MRLFTLPAITVHNKKTNHYTTIMSHYKLPSDFVVKKSYIKPMTSVTDHGFRAVLVEDYETEVNCCTQFVLAHNYHDDGDEFMFFRMNIDKVNRKIHLLNTLAYNFHSFDEEKHFDHFDEMKCWMKIDMRAIFQCLLPCDYTITTHNDVVMDDRLQELLHIPPPNFDKCQLYIQNAFKNVKSNL
jgi:hypothetical protein